MIADTKECPFCAETIKTAAMKCRFCGEWLDDHTRDLGLRGETVERDKVGGDKTSIENISDVKGVAIGKGSQAAVAGDSSFIFQTKDGNIEITPGKRLRDIDFEILSQSHDLLMQIRNVLIQKFRPPSTEEHRLKDLKIRATEAFDNTPALQRIMGEQWANEYRSNILDAIVTSLKMSKRDQKAELEEINEQSSEESVISFIEDWDKESVIANNLDKLIMQLQEKLNE
ncbi:hypothetical protein [Candidatus Leptofilum sp.]|uniref:hypothetical protein n=1 Tax=Candidatus Leptofilum sp. TaxID=3241576 RepID=UPI003B5A3BBA